MPSWITNGRPRRKGLSRVSQAVVVVYLPYSYIDRQLQAPPVRCLRIFQLVVCMTELFAGYAYICPHALLP